MEGKSSHGTGSGLDGMSQARIGPPAKRELVILRGVACETTKIRPKKSVRYFKKTLEALFAKRNWCTTTWHSRCSCIRHRFGAKAQRKFLLRAISAYQTASPQALPVIAGAPPIRLLVGEQRNLRNNNTTDVRLSKGSVRDR